MKKYRKKGGFTLLEMLIAIAILVLLTVGMGTGMDVGARAYGDSIFESDSSALADILNNSLGDILRYSENIKKNDDRGFQNKSGEILNKETVDFVFTSYDYGIRDAYFCDPSSAADDSITRILMGSLVKTEFTDLVNTGSYPNLKISKFKVTYTPPGEKDAGGKGCGPFFEISYTIANRKKATQTRDVKYVVRLLNAPPVHETVPDTP